MNKSENINELTKAMVNAQGKMKSAIKGQTNPYFKSKYADLAAIQEVIREPFFENGLCYFQNTRTTPNSAIAITFISHVSGQWIETDPYEVPVTKKDAHGFGSATTYAKRYSLSAAVGISTDDEDDDANGSIEQNNINKYEKISQEQLMVIENLINGHNDIRERLLKRFKSLQNIDKENFESIVNTIHNLIKDKKNNGGQK